MFRYEFCFLLMFHSTFLLPADRDRHFHIQQKMFLLAPDNMSDGSQKRKVHKTDNESEDNSDFKVVAPSLIQKKKSGPASVKQHYVQERLPRHLAVSSFRQPPSNERKTAQRLCCIFDGPAESNKVGGFFLWTVFRSILKRRTCVFRKLCRKDFSCTHRGQYDCRKHIKSRFHKNDAE